MFYSRFLVLLCLFVVGQSRLFHKNQHKSTGLLGNASYSQDNATRTLYFAYGAYCDSDLLKTWTCKWCDYIPGFQVSTVVTKDFLLAFVGFDTEMNQIVVSFRGTHNIEDWLDDLEKTQIDYPGVTGAMVHKGFYKSWTDELETEIMSATQSLMDANKGTRILVTGHSLGGALTQLAALTISEYAISTNNDAYIICYTYGSPRWGNDVLADYFGSQIPTHWRLTNEHDVVPTVPEQEDNYHHTWTQIWYKKDDPLSYIECDGSGEDPACEYVGYSVYDHLHYMGIYETCTNSSNKLK